MSLECEVCSGSSAHIRNETRLRGVKMGLVNVGNYADGLTFIQLVANVEKYESWRSFGLHNCFSWKRPFLATKYHTR